MTATAISPDRLGAGTQAHEDVILILGYTSWARAGRRGRIHPEDRLTLELIDSDRVRRLLVCNPFRSLPSKLLGNALGGDSEPFPASATRRLHEPLRARRRDPARPQSVARSRAWYERSVRKAAAAMGLHRPAVITTDPLIAGFGGFGWAGPVTYYATDNLAAFPPFRRWWHAFEESQTRIEIAGRRLVGVTPGLLSCAGTGRLAAVVPNGIEPSEWLRPGPPPTWFLELPRPRMVYVGTLDDRLDPDGVRAIAAAWPQGSIALVGRDTGESAIAALGALPNVTIHPGLPRKELIGLVAAADVGLIPHRRTALTAAMSPLKLYEYLAAGVPVAAADLPGIADACSGRTVLASSAPEMAMAVKRALELGPWSDHARRDFISENAWSRRFEQLLDVALAAEPRSSRGSQARTTRRAEP